MSYNPALVYDPDDFTSSSLGIGFSSAPLARQITGRAIPVQTIIAIQWKMHLVLQ